MEYSISRPYPLWERVLVYTIFAPINAVIILALVAMLTLIAVGAVALFLLVGWPFIIALWIDEKARAPRGGGLASVRWLHDNKNGGLVTEYSPDARMWLVRLAPFLIVFWAAKWVGIVVTMHWAGL